MIINERWSSTSTSTTTIHDNKTTRGRAFESLPSLQHPWETRRQVLTLVLVPTPTLLPAFVQVTFCRCLQCRGPTCLDKCAKPTCVLSRLANRTIRAPLIHSCVCVQKRCTRVLVWQPKTGCLNHFEVSSTSNIQQKHQELGEDYRLAG